VRIAANPDSKFITGQPSTQAAVGSPLKDDYGVAAVKIRIP
jgi:hypothetical protein